MTEYKVKSEYRGGEVYHKFYQNDKENHTLKDMERWATIADFHREQIFKFQVGNKIETKETVN